MNCLLISATASEIAPFLTYYRDAPKIFHLDINIDVLITGVGLTAATYHLGRQVRILRPDLVIQAGIAGSFDSSIPNGSVVAVKQDLIADEGVKEKGRFNTVFDLGFTKKNQFPYKNGWLVNPAGVLLKRSKLKIVRGISVNQVSTERTLIAEYRKKYKPVTESMEGAACHYVCLMEKIPFLQIRALSNPVGERNKKNWNTGLAIQNLNRELIRLLEIL